MLFQIYYIFLSHVKDFESFNFLRVSALEVHLIMGNIEYRTAAIATFMEGWFVQLYDIIVVHITRICISVTTVEF